jgi:hypothetical protein
MHVLLIVQHLLATPSWFKHENNSWTSGFLKCCKVLLCLIRELIMDQPHPGAQDLLWFTVLLSYQDMFFYAKNDCWGFEKYDVLLLSQIAFDLWKVFQAKFKSRDNQQNISISREEVCEQLKESQHSIVDLTIVYEDIMDKIAYVAVERQVAKQALNILTDGKIKGRSFRARALR